MNTELTIQTPSVKSVEAPKSSETQVAVAVNPPVQRFGQSDVFQSGNEVSQLSPIEAQQRAEQRLQQRIMHFKIESSVLIAGHKYKQQAFANKVEFWNKDVVQQLPKAAQGAETDSSGAVLLDGPNLQHIKFMSVAKPTSLGESLWHSLPDKLECPDLVDIGGREGDDEWLDSRTPPGSYQNLVNLKYDLSFVIYSLGKTHRLIREAQELGQDSSALEEHVEKLKVQIEQMERLYQQAFNLGKLLRISKTVKVLFEPGAEQYLKRTFIDQYIESLKKANPIDRPKILQAMKAKIKDLLGDLRDFQVSSYADIKAHKEAEKTNNASQSEEDKKLQAIFEEKVSKVMDKLYFGFGKGIGQMMLEQVNVNDLLGDESEAGPLGVVPEPDLGNIKDAKQKEAWQALYKHFGEIHSGKLNMTIAGLLPFVSVLLETGALSPGNKVAEGKYNFLNSNNSNALEVLALTKSAFAGFFSPQTDNAEKPQEDNLSRFMVGFVPFASSAKSQAQLESILCSAKALEIYPELDGSGITPAILSRIMFMYSLMSDQKLKAPKE